MPYEYQFQKETVTWKKFSTAKDEVEALAARREQLTQDEQLMLQQKETAGLYFEER